MAQPTNIEWSEHSWNFLRGCRRVSEGCGSDRGGGCYAERQAIRQSQPGQAYHGLVKSTPKGPRWTGELAFIEEILLAPLKRKKPTTYFVNSMSDLFYEKVSDEMLDKAFAVMALCPRHTFQILTKRPERMLEYMMQDDLYEHWSWQAPELTGSPCSVLAFEEFESDLPNVWLGVSVEDQKTADERIPQLLRTPAAVRWLSVEPLLGPVDLGLYLGEFSQVCQCGDTDIAFNYEVGNDCGKKSRDVEIAVDVPSAHRLPAPPLDSLIVPSDPSAEGSMEPIDDFRRGAVNREADAIGSSVSPTNTNVPLAIKESGSVGDDSRISRDAHRLRSERSTVASERDASGREPPSHGRPSNSEFCSNCGKRMAAFIVGDRIRNGEAHSVHNSNYNTGLGWIVTGGESGPGARSCNIEWIRAIVDQCKAAGVPVFVKQLGAVPLEPARFKVVGDAGLYLSDRKGGKPSEWPEDLRIREFPEVRG